MFDTEDRRDRAVTKILKASFRWEGVVYKLTVHNFGDSEKGKLVIWQTSANLLATGEDIRDAIIEHVLQIEPLFSSPFEVRQIIDNDMPTGKWAIKFDNGGPTNFQKQMKMGRMTVLITQEPTGTCRFCGNSGHTIFTCTTKSDKELGAEVVRGTTGITSAVNPVIMEE
ncbi:hypothetical protein FRX31_006988 [Thalictrum thalictroides]|uniref:Uncharacterized protein n=1 Tax=Thalictrum thalictroides TaxID=46969 RepID=A0A7J6X3F3_THATH|nr:hypothetical protein FRX31_006988 [Thalictrum thalictroides]